MTFCLCSFIDSLDFAPIDRLFEHDSGRLHRGQHLQHAQAHPEEDDHEDNAEEGVGVEPLADVGVCVEDALGFSAVRQSQHCHQEGSLE